MFERFTERALQVVMIAQEESRRIGHNYVGTEQILLGLIGEGSGIGYIVLNKAGVTIRDVRGQIEHTVGRGTGYMAIEIPFTPRGKKVLEIASGVSNYYRHGYIGTEHLMVALLKDREGVAIKILKRFNLSIKKLRIATLLEIAKDNAHPYGDYYPDGSPAYPNPHPFYPHVPIGMGPIPDFGYAKPQQFIPGVSGPSAVAPAYRDIYEKIPGQITNRPKLPDAFEAFAAGFQAPASWYTNTNPRRPNPNPNPNPFAGRSYKPKNPYAATYSLYPANRYAPDPIPPISFEEQDAAAERNYLEDLENGLIIEEDPKDSYPEFFPDFDLFADAEDLDALEELERKYELDDIEDTEEDIDENIETGASLRRAYFGERHQPFLDGDQTYGYRGIGKENEEEGIKKLEEEEDQEDEEDEDNEDKEEDKEMDFLLQSVFANSNDNNVKFKDPLNLTLLSSIYENNTSYHQNNTHSYQNNTRSYQIYQIEDLIEDFAENVFDPSTDPKMKEEAFGLASYTSGSYTSGEGVTFDATEEERDRIFNYVLTLYGFPNIENYFFYDFDPLQPTEVFSYEPEEYIKYEVGYDRTDEFAYYNSFKIQDIIGPNYSNKKKTEKTKNTILRNHESEKDVSQMTPKQFFDFFANQDQKRFDQPERTKANNLLFYEKVPSLNGLPTYKDKGSEAIKKETDFKKLFKYSSNQEISEILSTLGVEVVQNSKLDYEFKSWDPFLLDNYYGLDNDEELDNYEDLDNYDNLDNAEELDNDDNFYDDEELKNFWKAEPKFDSDSLDNLDLFSGNSGFYDLENAAKLSLSTQTYLQPYSKFKGLASNKNYPTPKVVIDTKGEIIAIRCWDKTDCSEIITEPLFDVNDIEYDERIYTFEDQCNESIYLINYNKEDLGLDQVPLEFLDYEDKHGFDILGDFDQK